LKKAGEDALFSAGLPDLGRCEEACSALKKPFNLIGRIPRAKRSA